MTTPVQPAELDVEATPKPDDIDSPRAEFDDELQLWIHASSTCGGVDPT